MSDGQTAQYLYFCEKSRKNPLFLHKVLNIGCILYFVTVCGKYIRLLARHRKVWGYVNCMKTATKCVGTENDPKAVVIRVGRYGHFRTEWNRQKDFIYPVNQTARFLIICENSWKNQLSYMKMLNNGSA